MRTSTWSTLLLTTITACVTGTGPRVPDQQVARLTAEQRTGVDAAQKAQSDADLAVASERVGFREAQRQVEIAEFLLDKEQAAVEVARLYVAVAGDSDVKERPAEARAQLADAEKRLARAKANLIFREQAEQWHAARVEHAGAVHAAAGAQLELQRFNAVTSADLIDETASAPERGKYQEALKAQELAVAEANTEVSRAVEAMRVARAAADVVDGPLDGSPQGLLEEPPTGEEAETVSTHTEARPTEEKVPPSDDAEQGGS